VGALAGPLKEVVDFLRAGGPLAVAVLAGYWALKKDSEARRAREAHEAAMKANFEQMVAVATAQATAQTKLETTIGILKDLIVSLKGDRG
jgi:hypothetical protein